MKIVEMDENVCVVEPNRKVYVNSTAGRTALAADAHDIENYDEMIGIWGKEPTVIVEPAPDPDPEPAPAPSGNLETRVAAVEHDVADLTAAVEKGLSL